MVYQDAGISRYFLSQSIDLLEVCIRETGENVPPSSLLYPPESSTFLETLCVRFHQRVWVYDRREVQPDFFGYKAGYCFGTRKEGILTNNYFSYARSIEFLSGIEPVNHMDYVWHDDSCGKVYLDACYLNRCLQEYADLYPHLKSVRRT